MMPAFPAALSAGLLSLLCGFLLKATLGYGLCWSVASFASPSSRRFRIWLLFLLSSAAYWIYSLYRGWMMLRHQGLVSAASTAHANSIRTPVWLSAHAAMLAGRGLQVASLAYALGLAILLILAVRNYLLLRKALRFRTAPPVALRNAFADLATDLHAPRCELWVLPGISSPASLGWVRSAVYLPADEAERSPQHLHHVLTHELSHLRRRDSLWEMLARICRAILFFHPMVYGAFSSLRFERELACDALVVERHPSRRDVYADTLVRFGWKTAVAGTSDRLGIGFTPHARVLHARIQAILLGEPKPSRGSAATRTLLSTAAIWTFGMVAPALWIGFAVRAVGSKSAAATSAARDSAPHIARSVERSATASLRGHALTRAASPAATEYSGAPPVLPRTDLRTNGGFHVQNEEEPMFNPRDETVAPSTPVLSGPSAHGIGNRPPMPSGTAMAIDAAVQLSRMGIGQGHDRD